MSSEIRWQFVIARGSLCLAARVRRIQARVIASGLLASFPLAGSRAMHLDDIKQALLASYRSHGGINHLDGVNLPSQASVNQLAADCMHLLFPGLLRGIGR